MTHLQTDIYSQICLFVQLAPQVPSVQLDPENKSAGLLVHMITLNIRLSFCTVKPTDCIGL